MQEGNSKQEIVRHVNELVAQLKNGTYHSPFAQKFAEVTIEDPKDTKPTGNPPESVPQQLHPIDKKRSRFMEMRKLARYSPSSYWSGPNDKMQAVMFYKQAKFMEDFEDDYEENAPFSMYFPSYQMMSYEQLRTYFTWRSGVRKGNVRQTSFSYVFLYLYELINNVGVKNCEDGLEKLTFLWDSYRPYEKKLDRYMNVWVRDYYITNDFTVPFEEALQKAGNLQKLYQPSGTESFFGFYSPYSDYKIEKSIFYTDETAKTIRACFDHVVRSLDGLLQEHGGEFEDLIFYSKSNAWVPFSKALFCSFSQPTQNKTVRLSETQRYQCKNGRWTSSENKIPKENGRAVVRYLLRRIEQFFRKVHKFKYKLTANPAKISAKEIDRWFPDPKSFFTAIDAAIEEYYRESQRKIITVNPARLETIRENAQMIQEKLLADIGEDEPTKEIQSEATKPAEISQPPEQHPEPPAEVEKPCETPPSATEEDVWSAFAHSLDETEAEAVRMILRDEPLSTLEDFAKSNGLMPEVLIDNINQKAIDAVDDSIVELSDRMTIFEEYRNDLKRVISIERR